MSDAAEKLTIKDRPPQRPSLSGQQIRQVRRKDLLTRFIAGGMTSIAAGAVTLAFGARVGGILLGLPAILAASLTLIEEEDDVEDAREDGRGAVLGGVAMIAFAAVAAVAFLALSPVVALLLATLAWAAVALGGYRLLWWH
jgi:Protein of unknown function (DUF3147)